MRDNGCAATISHAAMRACSPTSPAKKSLSMNPKFRGAGSRLPFVPGSPELTGASGGDIPPLSPASRARAVRYPTLRSACLRLLTAVCARAGLRADASSALVVAGEWQKGAHRKRIPTRKPERRASARYVHGLWRRPHPAHHRFDGAVAITRCQLCHVGGRHFSVWFGCGLAGPQKDEEACQEQVWPAL